MSTTSHVSVRWSVLVLAAVMLLAVGAGAAWVGLRATRSAPPPDGLSGSHHAMTPTTTAATSDGAVKLDADAIARAGITFAVVEGAAPIAEVRAPGIVEPDAYKLVTVTPLAGGRITEVVATPGQHVRRGQTLARIFSPDLTEQQTRYVSTRAMLEAHERELARTERLATIGAASRQELERLHAEHTARRAELQSLASRLQLLGVSPDAIDGLARGVGVSRAMEVRAPLSGIVTARTANVGLNVDATTTLFTVVDVSRIWIVADLYEQDMTRIRVGTEATVTSAAYPGLAIQGRVSYIDPQIATTTRTAKVRIEAPNPGEQLRLGTLMDVSFRAPGGGSVLTIPRTAVQHIADRTVVYLSDPRTPGTFLERDVRLGSSVGDRVSVVSGVQAGDRVVASGSFFVRAERERLGQRASE